MTRLMRTVARRVGSSASRLTSNVMPTNSNSNSSRHCHHLTRPITGGATGDLGVCTPLFENVGLLIRPNFHRNSGGEVGA